MTLILLLLTIPAACIALSRLFRGARRSSPVAPQLPLGNQKGTVSAIVPTLNEEQRIRPCLEGLREQSEEIRDIIVVDSRSEDGTQERVKEAQTQDPRLCLITDPPLPTDWVGRPWALHNGFLHSSPQSEWILGIDADTQPKAGLVSGLLEVARSRNYDVISLSPQFILEFPGEWWLQPALLMTLIYRFESSGVDAQTPERVMANGQCFFCRRSVLEEVSGYTEAKGSFCDDVTLARTIAARGFKVGFLDGRRVLSVRMYEGARETWREWGRSLDLKDASSVAQLWCDLWVLLSVQGLPLPLFLGFLALWGMGYSSVPIAIALGFNGSLVLIRWALLFAIAPSYHPPISWLFWLSPLADPLAVLRIFLSAQNKPTQWRGRAYKL
ncbi:glycosyltransferase [Lusitaniella coriacea LEGE 07157]|uniref:4,4'-diaponeurosporenoate glycosyltransferase n=1 Tax=Lusitaniella coriacea LEGE 07157 TaxID=945747 RepID=A0A8J7JCE8_9CYAN|nr:glycosyltransferase family 2 protein [Lusitaniella coriacea]MBE9117390.1 glycosyltransferase [Lusitaniella coriacea LEGE 07157]